MYEREWMSRVHTATQAAVLAQPRRPFLHPSCELSTVFASATSFIFRAARSFEPFALSGCHLPTTHASARAEGRARWRTAAQRRRSEVWTQRRASEVCKLHAGALVDPRKDIQCMDARNCDQRTVRPVLSRYRMKQFLAI